MICLKYFQRFYQLCVLLLLSCLFFSSCGVLKRTKTVTVTETITKIDTVIHYVHDTATIIKTGFLHDTVTVENKSAIAKEYYDFKTQKINLSLTGKTIDIPVYANIHTKETKKEVVISRKSNIEFIIFFTCAIIAVYLVIEKLKKP
jgi:hypothetical protein